MFILGITGGIGCGKSTVCKYIEEAYGAEIWLADDVGREVCKPDGIAMPELRKLFGPEYFFEDGSMNRKKIGAVAFKDPKLLQKMNEIIHPAVREYIEDRMEIAKKAGVKVFLIEAALFIEAGYDDLCDELWYVYSREDIRIKRLIESRGMTEEQVRDVMSRQLSEMKFEEGCDRLIDNSDDFETTKARIAEAMKAALGTDR